MSAPIATGVGGHAGTPWRPDEVCPNPDNPHYRAANTGAAADRSTAADLGI